MPSPWLPAGRPGWPPCCLLAACCRSARRAFGSGSSEATSRSSQREASRSASWVGSPVSISSSPRRPRPCGRRPAPGQSGRRGRRRGARSSESVSPFRPAWARPRLRTSKLSARESRPPPASRRSLEGGGFLEQALLPFIEGAELVARSWRTAPSGAGPCASWIASSVSAIACSRSLRASSSSCWACSALALFELLAGVGHPRGGLGAGAGGCSARSFRSFWSCRRSSCSSCCCCLASCWSRSCSSCLPCWPCCPLLAALLGVPEVWLPCWPLAVPARPGLGLLEEVGLLVLQPGQLVAGLLELLDQPFEVVLAAVLEGVDEVLEGLAALAPGAWPAGPIWLRAICSAAWPSLPEAPWSAELLEGLLQRLGGERVGPRPAPRPSRLIRPARSWSSFGDVALRSAEILEVGLLLGRRAGRGSCPSGRGRWPAPGFPCMTAS